MTKVEISAAGKGLNVKMSRGPYTIQFVQYAPHIRISDRLVLSEPRSLSALEVEHCVYAFQTYCCPQYTSACPRHVDVEFGHVQNALSMLHDDSEDVSNAHAASFHHPCVHALQAARRAASMTAN